MNSYEAGGVLLLAGVLVALLVHILLERRWRREADERQRVLLGSIEQAIRGLGSELSDAITPVLRDSFDASVTPVLGAIGRSLERLSRDVERTQREALAELTGSFRDRLSESFREEFEALARTLHENAAWHEQLHRDLEAILRSWERLGEGQGTMLRRTLKVSEAVRANGASLARAERSLSLVADRVQGTTTELTSALEHSAAGMVAQLQGSADILASQLQQLTQTLNEQMEETSTQLARRIQGISLNLQRRSAEIDSPGRGTRPGGYGPRGF